jgi:hypothetical protein
MTTRKKATAGRKAAKKLKLRTETIRDLDVKGKGKDIKGGGSFPIYVTCKGCPTK